MTTVFLAYVEPRAVMAGLVPAIHAFLAETLSKAWMPATSAGTTWRVAMQVSRKKR
jgi:hypothetical protein